jgi:flagellar FliJ protein
MKRFEWRLQRVLDLKEKTEKVKKAELLKLAEEIAAARVHLMNEQRKQREQMAAITQERAEQRVARQASFLTFSAFDDERIAAQRDQIRQLEDVQKTKTQELIELRRAKEGLEKLRAEAKETYMAEQERVAQREMDEHASMAFARQKHKKENQHGVKR